MEERWAAGRARCPERNSAMLIKKRIVRTARRNGSSAMVDLRKRRNWFADDDDNQAGQDTDSSKSDPKNLDEAMRLIEALQKRVGDRDDTIGGLKAQLDGVSERITAMETAATSRLEDDGKWKELAAQRAVENETLKLQAARAETLDGAIRTSNETLIANIPEQMRSMVPLDYPPEQLQAWLTEHGPTLAKQPAPDFNAGEGSGGSGKTAIKLSSEEQAMAAQYGMSAEQYSKFKEQRGQPIEMKKPQAEGQEE